MHILGRSIIIADPRWWIMKTPGENIVFALNVDVEILGKAVKNNNWLNELTVESKDSKT